MMKRTITLLGVILTAAMLSAFLGACNNFFHDLIPPDDTQILSFHVDGQLGEAVITDNSVLAVINKGVVPDSLLPHVSISHRAVLLPVTLDYVRAAFPVADLTQTAAILHSAGDITAYVMELIKENPDFTIPALDIPIDFSGPVTLLVVSARGTVRQYTVKISVDTGEPRLLNFGFSKYENAELIRDARCAINENAGTVTANALYPMEMDSLSYALVPSFEILGDSLIIDGAPVASGVSMIQFAPGMGSQEKTVTVTRDGLSKDYTLIITFSEDPDSVRSITDFRFNRADNTGIAANAVASIINTDSTGTITVQVFYTGVKPQALTPRFISPGTVSVNGVTQTSGADSRDFSSAVEYRVVSRNGQYTRTYTVKVEYINVTDSAPEITSFRFSAALNAELVQDAEAQISGGIIMIDARYGGAYPPEILIPEFRAGGLVSVYGSIQVSGFSGQDFSRQIKYTVTNPQNELLTREYWVQCRFVRDTSLDAAITSFGFYPQDNSGLADAVIGKIDQINGKITVYAPIGSGLTARTAYARFSAAGQVSINGTAQVSGESGNVYNAPVTYTVVSANGKNSREYTVYVRELMSTMYVNQNAFGSGDGTSWENAFRNLQSACEAAAQFPQDMPKEIWIAAGTYRPKDINDCFPLAANTSYIGGFAGNETSKSQRNVAANVVTVSGDLGGVLYAKRLFAASSTLKGDVSFENLNLTGVKGQQGAGIYALLDAASELTVTDCSFDNMEASGDGGSIYVSGGNAVISGSTFDACTNGAIYVRGTKAVVSDLEFSNCTTGSAAAVWLDCSGATEITRVNVTDSSGNGFYLTGNGNKTLETLAFNRAGQCLNVQNTTGDIRINGLVMKDITGSGIYMNGANGVKRLSGVSGANISGSAVSSMAASGSFTLNGTNTFDNTGIISITNGSGAVSVLNTDIKKSKGDSAVSVSSSANIVIDAVTIDGVPNGRGMYINTGGSAAIANTVIKNCVTTGSGGGIYISGSGSANISNTTIDTVTLTASSGYGGIYRTGGSLKVENSKIYNITGNSGDYCTGIYHYSGSDLVIDVLELKNITGNGICIISGSGARKISGITAVTGIGHDCGIYSSVTRGSITISDSTFNSCGVYCIISDAVPVTVTDTEIRNVRFGLYVYGGGVTIKCVTINGMAKGGRGIIMYNTSSVAIANTVIKNFTTDDNGGGIYIKGTQTAEISGTTIENVEAFTGGGIYIQDGGSSTISGCTIKNVKAGTGGGVANHSSNLTITDTTIENAEATNGGGVFSGRFGGAAPSSLTINGCTIKNAKASYEGGGVKTSDSQLTIDNTTFELCLASDSGGAVYHPVYVGNENYLIGIITNSRFINCTARENTRNLILDAHSFSIISGCEFIHDSNLPNMGSDPAQDVITFFGNGGGTFEYCTFTNLKIFRVQSGGSYLFDRFYNHTGTMWIYYFDLVLRNCTFNFNAGSAGLLALHGGSSYPADYLLMDGNTINDTGGQRPLIWLHNNSTPGTFKFKPNNTYNGTLLDTAAKIANLASGSSNVIRISNGAMPVLVP
jgi:hypothetical protein